VLLGELVFSHEDEEVFDSFRSFQLPYCPTNNHITPKEITTMSTLNALAQKHGITVPLRISDCPKVLTIVKIDNQMLPNGEGGHVATDVLTAKAVNDQGEQSSPTYTIRLNQVLVSQLVRIFGTDAEIEGKRVLASTFESKRSDGDKSYIAFAPPPTLNPPTKPKFLPGPGEGTAPTKDHTQFALNPEAQAALASLERTMKTI
jgi:hypothetical protein